jgi:hypothetical protein
VCPPLGTGRASIQCRGRILLNRRRCPLPLLSLGGRGPCVEHAKWSATRGHPDEGIRPNVRVLALPHHKVLIYMCHKEEIITYSIYINLSLIIKRQKFRLFFSSIHLFGPSTSNNRTMKSILSELIYMPGARPQLYIYWRKDN